MNNGPGVSDVHSFPVPQRSAHAVSIMLSLCQLLKLTDDGDDKTKNKAEHLYSAFHGIQTTLKSSGMDHTV